MKRLILLAFVAATLPAISDDDSGVRTFKVTLPAGDFHEECMTLKVGDWRKYEWKSDVPVDFNIHYHHAAKVNYSVKRAGLKSDTATFVAKAGAEYCWMWTANKPANLEGSVATK